MANIYTGNGLKIFYNEDTANRLPQNAGNEQISEIAAMPTLHIAAAMAQVETYDSEYVEQLAGEQNVDPVEITVNYIPSDDTHKFLDEATETQKEFQLILIRRHTEGTLDYSLMNGRISAAALSGDKDAVVQKTYTFTPTEMIVRDATALASKELYEGSYGVGSNGVDVPQYGPVTPKGNSFIKVSSDQKGNPVSADMMGIGLIDGNTFSSLAMTKSGSLAIYAKNQTSAWTRILTSNLGDSKYVALTGDQSIDGTKTFIKGIYVDSLTASNGISGKSLTVTEDITGERLTVENSTLGIAQADNLTLGQPLSVSNGGTGSKNATDARSALGVKDAGTFDVVPLLNGGTGATTAIQARLNLGIKATAGFDILPIVNGGTGATTALGARNNIDVYAKSEVYTKTESESKYLDKSKNLSDIINISTAKTNLQVDRLQQINNSTLLTSQDVNQRLILRDDKVWGYFDATGNKWNALGVTQGGTGASTPVDARTNLQLNRFVQSPTYSYVTSPAGTKIVIVDGGKIEFQNDAGQTIALPVVSGGTGGKTQVEARENLQLNRFIQLGSETHLISPDSSKKIFLTNTSWGAYDNVNKQWLPLPVANGGTGALDAAGARTNLQIDRIRQDPTLTHVFTQNGRYSMVVDNNGRWGGYDLQNGTYVPLRITDGGTGATNAADARTNLQVDCLVQSGGSTVLFTPSRNVALTLQDSLWGVYKAGTNDTIPLAIYSGGTGGTTVAAAAKNLSTFFMMQEAGGSGFNYNNLTGDAGAAGVIRSIANAGLAGNAPTNYRRNAPLYGYGGLTTTSYNPVDGVTSQMYISHRGQLAYRMKWGGSWTDPWNTALDNSNTTIDSNGFIKAASPIVKVFADGTSELNSESEGVVTKRIDTGVYEVSGTKGLNQDGWTIEIPQDVNGNRLCFVETSYDEENEVLTLKTFTRKFDINTAMVIAGEPMEVPSGRWIDLRVEMPEDSIYNTRFPQSPDEENK